MTPAAEDRIIAEKIIAFVYGFVGAFTPSWPPAPRIRWTEWDRTACVLGYGAAIKIKDAVSAARRAREAARHRAEAEAAAERRRTDADAEAAAEREWPRVPSETTRLFSAAFLLGVPVNADPETINRAFRQRVREVHADLNGGDGEEARRLIEARELMLARWREGRR